MDEGDSSITSYRIEWSANGTSDWQELVANHDTMAAGKIVTGYSDIGLGSETTRHYRVFATNDQGTGLASSVVDTTTADIAPPTFVSASVAATGTSLTIVFNETLDATEANRPAPARFAVTAVDGARFEIAGVAVAGTNVTLALVSGTSVVRADQAVTVAYTDPNADGDDPRGVVQDDSGNDAADFTTGENDIAAVVNNSAEPVTAPDAPAGFEAEGADSDRIRLRWDAPADTGGREITGYFIEVSEDGNPLTWTELAGNHNTMNDGRFEYLHTSLSLGAVRHYRVSARNGSLEADVGEASAVVTATAVHPGAPAAPPALTATPGLPSPRDGTTQIRLSWTKPANEGESQITGYRIDYSEDVAPLVWQKLVADTGNRNRAYVDIGLPSETTRHYRVFATNDQGTGLASSVVDTTTADIAPPTFVSASVAATGTSLTIVFDETLDATEANRPAPARFAVTAVDGARFEIAGVAVAGTNVTLALVSGTSVVRADQAVTVAYTDPNADGDDPRGVVQDDSGNDAADFTTGENDIAAVVNNSAEPVTAPDAPAGFEAEGADSDRIRLRWDAPADTGGREITGYFIEVSEDVDPLVWTERVANHNAMNGGRFEYIHMGLSLGAVRHYRVSARNGSLAADVGEASAVVTATTVHPGAPDAPTGLTATPGLPSPRDGTTQIVLAWKKPVNEGASSITSYRIEWSADGTSDWQPLVANHDTMASGKIVTGYSDTGLGSETTRHYRVFAINDQGTGLGSSVVDTTTADIAPPTFVSASVAATGTSLTIVFDETLDATEANLPAPARFAVTAVDGARFAVADVAVAGKNVTLTLVSGTATVRAGQKVTLAYTDPDAADDPKGVVQDDSGNDAADFTTGKSGVGAVVNNSAEPVTAPDAPAGLEAEGAGGDRIRLRWDAPADTGGREITGYFIEVSEDVDPLVWTERVANHNAMNGGRFEYIHMGLSLGAVRHYRVSARNGSLEADVGEASVVVKATTVHPGAPAAPTGLTATPGLPTPRDGTTLISLSWAKPTNEGESSITSYRIEWSADVAPLVWQELVANHDTMAAGKIVTGYSDIGLGSETTRHYRVFAINDEGTGLGSSAVDTTTADIAPPTFVSASVAATGTSLTIVFNETLDAAEANLPAPARFAVTAVDGARFAVADVAVAGKNVTLALASGTAVVRAGQKVTLAYTDPDAADDPKGVVQDDSGNDAADFTTGKSGVGAVVNNSAEPVTAPDAPAGLEAEGAGGDRIRLRWDAPADTGGREITGYRIEASEDDDPFSWTELASGHDTMNDGRFEYTHLGLSLGDVRHYRVSAINSAGTGTATAVVRGITVPPGAPDAPPGVTATADGGTAIDLAWDAPANTGDSAIRSYTIEWSPDGMTNWQLLRSTGPAARAHPDTDLSSETTRHYRIFAVNDEGSSAGSEVVSATTDDILGPEPQSATVAAAGTSIAIVFDEALADASASLPAPGAFTVRTGDGVQIAIDSVSVTDTVMTLSAASTSPTIKTGQTVTVTYTDPSAADDAAAIQDEADNDAASFTLGPGRTVTVTNGSTVPPTVPGAPTDLAVQGVGGDRIALTWTKPRDTGGRAISSYFIEVSEDGGTEFSELVPDHNTMVGGEIALRYLHTGLEATDVRHYRVSAKNSVGTGTASITAMGQPVEPIGRVDIAFDTPAATEGIALGWTVTATTLADEQPQSDFALRVAVASEADTAGDADYTRVAETVSFARSDFARRSVGGQMRWVAEKTGQVTTNDDVEVEATETFALTATVTNIVQSRFLTGTGRAEGSIEDNDTWTIEVIADPTSVAEGESRDVKLTARIAPASTECVVPFPVTVSLSATGTATSGTDYRLNGETNDQEIAPCTAETSWPVTMTSNVDTADDDGETVVFTPEIAGTPAIAPEPFQPATVTLRETRGVLLSALSLNAEEGRSTTYTMVLTSRPTGTVTVRPEVSGDMDVTVSPASLAFTPGDWNVRQTVKVHAAPDADEDDDAAEVSHQVSGADYGTNRVSAGSIAISVQDDDATFGELTVGVLVGDAHNSSAAAAPRVHFGEPFTIKLWWSEIRTREWEKPQLAIGADRAIRVTGADVTPVKDDMTDTWSRTSLRLKFTPHGTDDVTLVIEPLDCTRDEHGRYNRHAICGWVGSDRGGNTGLTERVRWTARGIAGAPAAPTNVTVSPGHRVHREQYQVAFDAEPAATRYRVQIQDAGGSWSSPRTLTDDASGRREEVAIEGVSHAQDYDVRVRWENRFGESPWVTVHTSDTLAPPQPTGLTLTQDDDGHSVSLAWTPDTGGTTARYQYRVADEWTDIAQSGPGEANRRAYTVGGLSHTWKMEAQVRGVGPTGRTGEPSETAKVAYTPPHVMEARIRMASSPGSEGHYGVGDRMLVAVPMNRPVRRSGPLPTLDLQIGSTTHALALSRREPSQLASGVVEVPETAVTLYFAHTVTKHDEDTDGVSIPANGLSLNAGQLLDATEDGNNRRATFTLSQPKHFAAHKVQGVRAEVERIEWLENRVWVHYNRDLAPAGWESTGAYIERQFNPTYSVSRPLDRPVLDARIVRGRGWGTPCRHAERGCRTVQLTLRGVVRGNPVISSRATHDAPAPDEQAWMSYAPDPHLEQFRLRDAVGNQVPAFTRIEARHLAAGTDSVLSVASAAGREGRDEAIRFTVRMVPAATSQVTVDYATREGTATANVDYTHVSGTLVFEPGQTAKTIDVPIENDTAKDSGETFTLTLGNPSGARLGDDEALGTIWNDEILSATFDALPDNHDGTTAFTFNLAFSEEIAASANTLKDSALSVAGGTVTEVEQTDAASTRRWSVTVEPWGAADVTIAIEVTQSCEAIGAICTSDDLELEERTQAIVRYTIGTVEIAGVPQVGRTLEASLSPAPGGTVTWQWLRGGVEIAGADASAYTPVAADVGARLAVRAGRGGAAATSEATAPVWPAPVNPPLGAGEEELLSAVLTLEAWHGFTLRVAGYGRVPDSRFGEMDGTAFEDGGTPRAVSVFAVNGLGTFVLATGAAAPRAAGLVAYWNGHRIAGLEAETAGGVAVLSGPTPQPRAAYLRYMDGSSDGVRVAVSLRRTRAAVRVTGAAVTSGPGDNGTWDADEHVEAEVRFSAPVTVTGPEDAAPTLGIALDGTRREAAYTGGSGTGTLSFRYTIAEEDEEDEGAKRARIVADGLSLNGAAIVDGEGRAAGLGFSVAPWVAAVAVEPDASGDGSWTPGETIGVRLTFSEAVTVAGGNPWLDVRIGGFARPLALGYASGSGSATLVFSMEVPRGARALTGIAAVADSLVANGAAIASEASGIAADLRHDGTDRIARGNRGKRTR